MIWHDWCWINILINQTNCHVRNILKVIVVKGHVDNKSALVVIKTKLFTYLGRNLPSFLNLVLLPRKKINWSSLIFTYHGQLAYLEQWSVLDVVWHQTGQGPISWWFFHRNSHTMKNLFLCIFIVRYQFARKFCTCHDSTAVMPCAKFHSNHSTTT